MEKVAIPPQFVNVVEDARIEKLMKRKYMGLAKSFFKGYQELNDEDFFSISDESVSTFNLADRANLYFKVGNFVDITFDSEEQVLIQKIADVETFDDVLKVAEELYLFCKKEKEEKVDDTEMPPNTGGESDQPASELQEQQDSPSEGSGDSEQQTPMPEADQSAPAPLTDEPEVQAADALESNLQDLVDTDGYENVYVEIPKVDLKYIIAKNDDIHKEMDAWFNYQQTKLCLLYTSPSPRD